MSDANQPKGEAWTLGRLLTWTTEYLRQHEIEDARLAAEVLLAHAAKCKRIELYLRMNEELSDQQLTTFRELVRRAAAHEPVAYLVGEKEFYSIPFYVTRDVLIPRPETETLVEVVLDHCRQAGISAPRLLDIGTGSGCIAIAVLMQLRQAQTTVTDISPAALAVARKNAERHGLIERMRFLVADKLSLPLAEKPEDGFDIIVCNPPYIPKSELPQLKPEVREYEPAIALTDQENGLSFYRHLGNRAAEWLAETGILAVEIADGMAQPVVEALMSAGKLVQVAATADRVTGLVRVVVARRLTAT